MAFSRLTLHDYRDGFSGAVEKCSYRKYWRDPTQVLRPYTLFCILEIDCRCQIFVCVFVCVCVELKGDLIVEADNTPVRCTRTGNGEYGCRQQHYLLVGNSEQSHR